MYSDRWSRLCSTHCWKSDPGVQVWDEEWSAWNNCAAERILSGF